MDSKKQQSKTSPIAKGLLELAKEEAEATRPNYRAIIIRFRDDIAAALAAGYSYKDARVALHKILAAEAELEGREPVVFAVETFRKWCRAEDLVPKPKSQNALRKKPRTTGVNAEPPKDESATFKHSATPDTDEIYGSDE